MSQPKSLLLSLLFSAVALPGTNSQALNQTIAGCEAVSCPLDGVSPHCTVTNHTFHNIGLSRIADVPDALSDFSLVKGVAVSGPSANEFTSVYYLGTPDNVNISEQVRGCAVIFNDTLADVFFPENGTHTCADVIPQDCIDAIQNHGTAVAKDHGDDDLCTALRADLDKGIPECEGMTVDGTNKNIGNFYVQDLANITNIDSARNGSSDCWPVLPKTENLAEIGSQVRIFDDRHSNASTISAGFDQVSSVLTVFVKGNSTNSSIVSDTVSKLTCLAINTTVTPPAGNENAAPRSTALNAFAMIGAVIGLAALNM